jgi:hypothetical protein
LAVDRREILEIVGMHLGTEVCDLHVQFEGKGMIGDEIVCLEAAQRW